MIVCEGDPQIIGANLRLRQQNSKGLSNELISIGVDLSGNAFGGSNLPKKSVDAYQSSFDERNEKHTVDVKNDQEACSKTNTGSIFNKLVTESDSESYFMARRLAREEGLLVGPSSGAVVSAAIHAINDNLGIRIFII
jgi:cysteine synthase